MNEFIMHPSTGSGWQPATAQLGAAPTYLSAMATGEYFVPRQTFSYNYHEIATNPNGQIATHAVVLQPVVVRSVVHLHDRKGQTRARFRLLRRLPDNHDGEGAAAAYPASVDRAMAFLDAMTSSVSYFATLSDEGLAVIEFEDRERGLFADITFRLDGTFECFRRLPGTVPELVVDQPESNQVRSFLRDEVGVVF
jgi:hypothetical protein